VQVADRDISPELAHALLDPGAARLPDRLAIDLTACSAASVAA
jgi:hypothetical protein